MWTKVEFRKNKELSVGSVVFGTITAVWNESQSDEFIYSEETDSADVVGFANRANAALTQKITEKTSELEEKPELVDIAGTILTELNKK